MLLLWHSQCIMCMYVIKSRTPGDAGPSTTESCLAQPNVLNILNDCIAAAVTFRIPNIIRTLKFNWQCTFSYWWFHAMKYTESNPTTCINACGLIIQKKREIYEKPHNIFYLICLLSNKAGFVIYVGSYCETI